MLITIDDGWKSVYTDAFPVLRAYGYPFTMFLYTTYIDVQGDSMTQQQLRAMMRCGATIGSHSVNHLYPKKWKRYAMESEPYKHQLQVELLDSRTTLLKLFGNCSTYCYPGGYNTPPMLDTLSGSAYQAAFTVEEAKVECGKTRSSSTVTWFSATTTTSSAAPSTLMEMPACAPRGRALPQPCRAP